MPISADDAGLQRKLDAGHVFSLDVLARMLVSYRDTRQATSLFRAKNGHLLETPGVSFKPTGSRRAVHAARLTLAGRALLHSLTSDDLQSIEALLGACHRSLPT